MGRKKKRAREKSKREVNTENLKHRDGIADRFGNIVRHRILIGIFLFVLSFAVFAPSLRNEFVWDDISYIELKSHEGATFRGVISNILNPFHAIERGPKHFRPVLYSSWRVDYLIWGLSPVGFHLSNIIFYSLSVVLFYVFANLVLGGFGVNRTEATAFFSALLFAVFPMHVEPVSFVAARGDLLCGIFFFLAIIFHLLSFKNLLFLFFALLGFYLSLLTKEIAITFPFVVLALDLATRKFSKRSNLLRYCVYGGLLFAYLYYRWGALGGALGFSSLDSDIYDLIIGRLQIISSAFAVEHGGHSSRWIALAWERSDLFLNSYLYYILKLIFPFNLNPFIASVPGGLYYTVISSVVISLLIVISAVSFRRREGIIAFSIVWILINLAPPAVVTTFPIALTPLAERFLFIPSAGFCLLVGYIVVGCGGRYEVKKIAWVAGLVVSLSYIYFTIDGQSVWRDSLSLWGKATSRSIDIYSAHLNYGNALRKAGKKEEAIREYQSAIELGNAGGKAQAYNNMGAVYIDMGDYDRAAESFRSAIDINPRDIRPHYNLGYMYFVKGERIFQGILRDDRGNVRSEVGPAAELKLAEESFELAEEYLKRTLELRGSHALANFYLAEIYLRFGEMHKAKEHAKNALRIGLPEKFAKRARKILEMN